MTPYQFFIDFFPNVYVCATSDNGSQFDGSIPIENMPNTEQEGIEKYFYEVIRKYQNLNKQGHNIFFTPNGVKQTEGKNRLENFNNINAWWIDIDIEETKSGDDEETMILRNHKKGEVLSRMWEIGLDKVPSLTIETRNGYQLYWFADPSATQENWTVIGKSIYEIYKKVGADKSTVKIVQLMRMPFFYYFKRGEQGKIQIVRPFSSFKRYSEIEMMNSFPTTLQPPKSNEIELPSLDAVFKPTYRRDLIDREVDDIFSKIITLPIDEVLLTLSKTWLVNGDDIHIERIHTDKSNLIVNGKVSPNFIVRSKNHIYSNNSDTKGPTIIQYLLWYKWTKYEIAKGLKEFFR